MAPTAQPLVSIGLPVFNGELGLARALDTLIEQDYENLEIIISDNGSTDSTEIICKRYLYRDLRVKYYRSETNHGASWNFNRVFTLSSGKYFMWASHDDDRQPSFVRTCVEKLEERPDAVLCHAQTGVYIQHQEQLLYTVSLNSFEDKLTLLSRYRETLRNFPACALYGVYRSEAMRRTKLFRKTIATDIAFAQELSIYGTFIQVPNLLFNYRARPTWNSLNDDYRFFVNHDRKPWLYVPRVVLFLDHWRRINDTDLSMLSKTSLRSTLILDQVRQIFLRILVSFLGKLCPRRWRVRVGIEIYRLSFGSSNIVVANRDLFFKRVVEPQLRW